jgi:hypothetical protein
VAESSEGVDDIVGAMSKPIGVSRNVTAAPQHKAKRPKLPRLSQWPLLHSRGRIVRGFQSWKLKSELSGFPISLICWKGLLDVRAILTRVPR